MTKSVGLEGEKSLLRCSTPVVVLESAAEGRDVFLRLLSVLLIQLMRSVSPSD